ncbi:hypothetical protein [Streptomyces sp. URMC 125]
MRHLRGHSAAADLAASYTHRRDRLRAEIHRTGADPAEITEWSWQP